MKYTGANSLTNDKDILPEIPTFDLPSGEDTATAQDSAADVDANATPDFKSSVEMPPSSSLSVSTESSKADSFTTAATTTTSNECEKECSVDNDDDLLDLLVETLDVDFDHNLLP